MRFTNLSQSFILAEFFMEKIPINDKDSRFLKASFLITISFHVGESLPWISDCAVVQFNLSDINILVRMTFFPSTIKC